VIVMLESQSKSQNHVGSQVQKLVQSAWRGLILQARESCESGLGFSILYCAFNSTCWHYRSLFHSVGFNSYSIYMQKVSQITKELTRPLKSGLKHQKSITRIIRFTKNRRIGQFACELANPAKLANSVLQSS